MSDVDNANANGENQQDDDDAAMDHVNKLAIPQSEVTARMMEAFPKCDLDTKTPSPNFLVQNGLTKEDAKALALLFSRH
jgi:hypothetical protein